MNKLNIDQIIERYWEGESTLDEEQLIREYLQSDQVADEHLELKALFGYFAQEMSIGSSRSFDTQLLEETSSEAKVFNLSKYVRAMAAVFALAICGYIGYQAVNTMDDPTSNMVYEVEDPEEALEITKQALAMLSTKLSNQTTQVSKDMQHLETATIFK